MKCPRCNTEIRKGDKHICPNAPPEEVANREAGLFDKQPGAAITKAPARTVPPANREDEYRRLKQAEEQAAVMHILVRQYPALEDLKELYEKDRLKFWKVYPSRLIEAVAKQLDIPMTGIDILGGKPYVNHTGLTAKVQKDKRRVKLIKPVRVLYPFKVNVLFQPDDVDAKKYFLGCSEDGTAVSRGIVEFQDGSRFEGEGTANAKWLTKQYNKMSSMIPYVMELADTRALNRAMREAIAFALVSAEELNERGIDELPKMQRKALSSGERKETERLQGAVGEVFFRLKLNDAKQLMYCQQFGGVKYWTELDMDSAKAMLTALADVERDVKAKRKAAKKRGGQRAKGRKPKK